ncbi:hypothetical protein PHAVU_006G026800 [Phaseolus vulgaris]|uniref:Bifunctional inhibitor/plant lipid transfer protein/seed storage helical domain-containing protein n=1 Tax=Phaseolus vulgaris TaxID=3885 RepID=V7BJY3_PHAVU|nr:hypothetical protein PHAVU_006G026800g [Phaseolus vulgaris]ESW18267.1 hypothetical protein PHAVU_006G026800g [Phaseolus vulgaris]
MGEKNVCGVVVLVMAYGLAITTLSRAQIPSTAQVPSICNGYQPLLFPCQPYLIGSLDHPTPNCCDGARVAFQGANNGEAIKKLCSCLVSVAPYLNFRHDKLVSLPPACNIHLSFSMDHCING